MRRQPDRAIRGARPRPRAGAEPGFVALFDGRGFDGWTGAIDGYEVRDGAIVCKAGAGGTLYTSKVYRNFVVRLEFRLPPAGNNGLAIRYPGSGDSAYAGMTELQVLDDTDPKYKDLDPRQAHGSAYGMVASTRGHLKPVGQWNEQEVTVRGSTITVVLNGTTILDADLATVTDVHGRHAASGQGPHRGALRVRRSQRPGRLPQHPHPRAALMPSSRPSPGPHAGLTITDLRVHTIAIADPPLRSSYGLHAPYALRTILELVERRRPRRHRRDARRRRHRRPVRGAARAARRARSVHG